MLADKLLERLEGVRKVGHDGWVARCPAHGDKRPSLSITDVGSKVLVKCHAGCSMYDIVAAVGLDAADLFERTADRYDGPQRKATFNARAVLNCLAQDATTVYVAGRHLADGRVLSQRDMAALQGAVERVRNGARLAGAI